MNVPDYVENISYKTLCELAKRMGLDIIYRENESFPDSVLAFADIYDLEDGPHKCVIMPTKADRILSFGKDPAAVLAHEMTHYLIEDFYTDNTVVNQENCFPLHLMLENDCDRMGLAIYLLAKAIASEKETM